ncbi:MAG: hypothetical protein HUU37_01700, partial [Bdellovibrionales bacterium]|nr:hypothetical protein [Bdellovibrionales bacterium]
MPSAATQRLTWVETAGPAPDWLRVTAASAGFSVSSVPGWQEAAGLHRTDSSALFLVPHGDAPGRTVLTKHFRGMDAPATLEVLGHKPDSIAPTAGDRAEILSPSVTGEELRAIIEDAAHSRRAAKRLAALRAHQTRGLDLQGNPALSLITTLVKSC